MDLERVPTADLSAIVLGLEGIERIRSAPEYELAIVMLDDELDAEVEGAIEGAVHVMDAELRRRALLPA